MFYFVRRPKHFYGTLDVNHKIASFSCDTNFLMGKKMYFCSAVNSQLSNGTELSNEMKKCTKINEYN